MVGKLRSSGPQTPTRSGLGMVYQHFTLVPSMTVAENLVMSRQNVPAVINWRAEITELTRFMQRMPFKVPLEVEVGNLAAGERQKTEIIKQLYLERKFLVLDEPTSVLTPQEATEMLGLVRGLAHAGTLTIVIITHKLKEVAAFVDEVTVLRRGRMAGTGAVKDLGPADLTAMMIGEPHAPKNPERKGRAIQRNPAGGHGAANCRGWRPEGFVDRRIIGPCARNRRHSRGVRQRAEGSGRSAGRPASGCIRLDHRGRGALCRKPGAVPGARRAGAAGRTAAQRLRATDDGGGQSQSSWF